MLIIENANELFRNFVPIFTIINFTLLIALIAWNWKAFQDFCSGIDNNCWKKIAGITLFALAIRILLHSHQHIMFMDEFDYMLAAKTFLQNHNVGEYQKSIAWPMMIAASFGVFGISSKVAIFTSTVMGAITVFAIFLLSYAISKKKTFSLTAALIFAVLPHHIIWSGCAETNVTSVLFIVVTMFFCFLYFHLRTTSMLWLVTVSLAFVSQFRPENFIFVLLFALGCIIFKNERKKPGIWAVLLPLAIMIALSFPNFLQITNYYIHQKTMNLVAGGIKGMPAGDNLSLSNLLINSIRYGWELFNPFFTPFPVTILAFLGIRHTKLNFKKEYIFFIFWFCVLWLLFFSSWFPPLGARNRFYLGFYPIFVIMACFGIEHFKDHLANKAMPDGNDAKLYRKAVIITAFIFALHLPIAYFSKSDSESRLETNIAAKAEVDIPPSCLIIMNQPVVLKATTDLATFPTTDFLNDQQMQDTILSSVNCVLFFEDLTCVKHSLPECEEMKKMFEMRPAFKYRDDKYILFRTRGEGYAEFTFYEVTGKAD